MCRVERVELTSEHTWLHPPQTPSHTYTNPFRAWCMIYQARAGAPPEMTPPNWLLREAHHLRRAWRNGIEAWLWTRLTNCTAKSPALTSLKSTVQGKHFHVRKSASVPLGFFFSLLPIKPKMANTWLSIIDRKIDIWICLQGSGVFSQIQYILIAGVVYWQIPIIHPSRPRLRMISFHLFKLNWSVKTGIGGRGGRGERY